MEQDQRDIDPQEQLTARQGTLQEGAGSAVKAGHNQRTGDRDPWRKLRQMLLEEDILQQVKDEKCRQVHPRPRRIERRFIADGKDRGSAAEDAELHGLECKRGTPCVRRSSAPDEIKNDQGEVKRKQIYQPSAVPDGKHAEHGTPCRKVDHQVSDRGRAGNQERGGIRAGHREQGVKVAGKRAA